LRRVLLSALVVIAAGAFLVIAGGASNSSTAGTNYNIELGNAFGLVNGADFKVAGVRAGTINSINLCWSEPKAHCQNPLDALVNVQVTQGGFGSFRTDAFCQSRPQSLIGEYFIECQPGTSGAALKNGSTITVNHTFSTIPGDLLQDVMRLPYRERFTLIINELGAAVAGRSGDLQAALQRAVPALTETDNLLNLLANDSHTLQALTADSDAVITALANNSTNVQRFIDEANNAASDTATQQAAFAATWQKLPAFLEQLRPTLAQLGAASDANTPVLNNLNTASGQLDRLFTDLPGFAHSSLPALKSLGKASVTGKVAVTAARPTVHDLNKFATHTPELAQNLAIVGAALDTRTRTKYGGGAIYADQRSPDGGKGYTGLEALLQYVFNQALAINTYTNFGHQLTVDAFVSTMCSPYANAASVASGLQNFGSSYRQCYAWYGPNQPGINERDPSNPTACVPDPGGEPPGHPGAHPSVGSPCKLTAADVAASDKSSASSTAASGAGGSGGASSATGGGAGSGGSGPPINLGKTVGQVLSALGVGAPSSAVGAAAPSTAAGTVSSGGNAKQLLNYLLAP
jgi:phospholipid/cholesterol/gamma-HCH transport system substrate-binding protein